MSKLFTQRYSGFEIVIFYIYEFCINIKFCTIKMFDKWLYKWVISYCKTKYCDLSVKDEGAHKL